MIAKSISYLFSDLIFEISFIIIIFFIITSFVTTQGSEIPESRLLSSYHLLYFFTVR